MPQKGKKEEEEEGEEKEEEERKEGNKHVFGFHPKSFFWIYCLSNPFPKSNTPKSREGICIV